MNLLLRDEQFLLYAQEIIYTATKSVDISTFKLEMSSKPRGRPLMRFFETLYQKRKQGVAIRLLSPVSSRIIHWPASNSPALEVLKKNNIEVRHLRNNRCCHAKIIIVDNKVGIIGSHNLSVKSCHYNFEISYMENEALFVKRLSCIYNHAWNTAQNS